MRISELLSLQAIDVNASVASKAEAIDYMTRLMEKSGNLSDREEYKKGVLAREIGRASCRERVSKSV